jgi:hypothetical protein
MKIPHSDARPPHWAETLLRMLLKPEDRESVCGDLLEEYREAIAPARKSAANRWYLWQVGSFVVRSGGAWGAVVGTALVVRYMMDTHVPVTDYKMRATALTYTIMAVSLLAGFSASWRTRSMRGGVFTSFSAAAIGAILSIAGTAVMLAIWHDAATLDAWRHSGGLDEAFIDVPIKVVAIGTAIGLAGALAGKGVNRIVG